jgi:hypothetical protein
MHPDTRNLLHGNPLARAGYQDQYNPVHHGFDEFVGFLTGATDYYIHGAWRDGLEKQNVPGYSTCIITDRSIEFTKRNRDNPFFLYVSHAGMCQRL